MEITKQSLSKFRKEFAEVVKILEEKHGVTIELGSITYDPNISFTSKLTVTNKKVDGKDIEQIEFEKYCGLYGIPKEHYNKTVKYGNDELTLKGFNPRSPKWCVIAVKKSDGKTYQFQESILDRFIKF